MNHPDIVYMVAACLSQNDQARLAQVSEFHFQLIIPLAWRTVTGVTQLFKLLPGVRVEGLGALTGTETIYLPRNLNVKIARFKFYANFVKHLLLFKNPAVVTKMNRWEDLLEYTNHNVLLPSLSSITSQTYWPESTSHYAWISVFSSPSVRRVEMRPLVRQNLPTISSETASAIFNILINRSPDIESISIFVDPKQRVSPLETGFYSDGSYYQTNSEVWLGAIKHIRSLSCTSSILEHSRNTPPQLGCFSKLENLQLYASQQDDAKAILAISLEPEAFSRLTRLTLYDFGPRATLSILKHLTFAAQLAQLTLEINHKKANSDEHSSVDEFYNCMLVPTICTQASHLMHLSIRPIWNDKLYVVIDDSSLDLLASLPLKSLTFARSQTNVACLSKVFPQIQTLRWPDQLVTLSQLGQFAEHHRLEHLSLKLDLSPSHITKSRHDQVMPPASPCILESDYGNLGRLTQTETRKLLEILAAMWNRSLILQQVAPFDYPQPDFDIKRRLEHINKEFEDICQALKT